VIVDEIHAVIGTRRGAHLALSMERLAALTATPPLRIGLSATQRPVEAVARFLVGTANVQASLDCEHHMVAASLVLTPLTNDLVSLR
jgi:ATP-dependent Lhr-like helicase